MRRGVASCALAGLVWVGVVAGVQGCGDQRAGEDATVRADESQCTAVPTWRCGGGASCQELASFDPRRGLGYWNYPKNGETGGDAEDRFYYYRSFARRDLVALVRYAAASTACIARTWRTGIGGPLGLGDMSERDGSTPGTMVGSPGHPAGTHVGGKDMDIAYFQKTSADNKLRPVCPSDGNHCTAPANNLDFDRTAVFIAKLHDNPQLRVIGVDGKIGPTMKSTIERLCASGVVSGPACAAGGLKLTWEATDTGRGWFKFHHHHFHVSLKKPSAAGFTPESTNPDDERI